VIVEAASALDLIERVLGRRGTPAPAAATQARILVEADLRGQHSHGLQRLPMLVARIGTGMIQPAAVPDSRWVSESFLEVDGGAGFGPVVAYHALEKLTARAHDVGLAVGAVHNSNHLGMLACYVEDVAAGGQIGVALTTSEALVHPWGGSQAMVGTNPIAIGVPTGGEPFVLDMSTGAVSRGKILAFARTGRPLEPGWAVDAHGVPVTDARAAVDGAISPFGGAKGYALGLGLELLVAGLSGAETGQRVRGTLDAASACNKGDLFLVFDPAALGLGGTAERMGAYLAEVRASPLADGVESIDVPGDRARRMRRTRLREGIPLDDDVWASAEELLSCLE
jgi:LDH2 family malate/lactate/ureidoglycolate dehydrogenase